MKKIIIGIAGLAFLISSARAQEVIYDIISTSGSIVDKKTGRELQVGDKVLLQTDLQFNSLNDRAVLLNPEKTKYFLELPKSSFVNSQLTVASSQALTPVKARPALITGVRGNSTLVTKGLSPQSLKEYFAVDTFTIVDAKFTIPVSRQDAKKYDLLLRYEVGNIADEYISTDFTISKNDLKIQGNRISECFVLLRNNDETIPVTQISLFFVDRIQLFGEFDSLLNALSQTKNDKNKTRGTLRQYCTDVYGIIDRNTLETTINDYLALK
jgi:hypothetical protein